MKTYGTKRVLPVYGNSRPVERRINNKKIVGWKEQLFNDTSVSQNDTYNDSAFLKIYGKSEQTETIQGKNLFDKNKVTHNSYYSMTKQGDDTYVTNLVSNSGYYLSDFIPCQAGVTYVTNRPTNSNQIFFDANKNLVRSVPSTGVTSNRITPQAEEYYFRTYCMYSQLTIDQFQIEIGLTPTSYESFVPNSPSPDYPSAINSVEDFDLVSAGRNLFDAYNYTTNYPDDIKVINQDGEDWIKMQSSNKQIRYNLKVKENTQHTFTFEFKRYDDTGSYSAVFVLYYTDGTSETIDFGHFGDGILHKVSKTSAENKTISYIRSANYGNTVYFLLRVANSQLEEGTTATPYTPFRGMQTINFPYTLRSLPDGTRDYIEIDNVNKTAKLVKNVQEYKITGSEKWYAGTTGTNVINQRFYSTFSSTISNGRCISSHFLEVYPGIANGGIFSYDVVGTNISNGNLQIKLPITIASTVAEFKAWLAAQYNAGTPVTVQYKLATPTIENLDYNEVKTYYPYTQIYTNATIQPTLDGTVRIIEK